MLHVIKREQTNFQVVLLSPLVSLSHMQPADFCPHPLRDRKLSVAAATQCKLFTKTEI